MMVVGLKGSSKCCWYYSLQTFPCKKEENRPYRGLEKEFHIAAKHPWILIMPVKLKVRRAGGMDKCSWHCEGDGKRAGDDIADEREGGWGGEEERTTQPNLLRTCLHSLTVKALRQRWHISIASTQAWRTVTKRAPTREQSNLLLK